MSHRLSFVFWLVGNCQEGGANTSQSDTDTRGESRGRRVVSCGEFCVADSTTLLFLLRAYRIMTYFGWVSVFICLLKPALSSQSSHANSLGTMRKPFPTGDSSLSVKLQPLVDKLLQLFINIVLAVTLLLVFLILTLFCLLFCFKVNVLYFLPYLN